MAPRIRLISAAAAVLIVCRAADRGEATVVRDGPAATGNPAVQTGGHPVRGNLPFSIQYTIIGGLQSQLPWFPPCAIWPWSAFNPFWQSRPRTILTLPPRRGGPFIPVAPRVP
nr:hypothetical protein [uncultured Rhodopila sp.]